MPNGITAAIYEGQSTSLRDYLMRVGRQCGFAVYQRDDNPDDPVKPVEPSDYHVKALVAAEARIAEVRAWSDEDADREAKAQFDAEFRRWLESRNEKGQIRERYEAMRTEVEAWQPDPIASFVKDQAIKYLNESIEFDCGSDDDRWYPEPKFVLGPQFREQELAKASHDADYHTAENLKEIARADERNKYIAAFLASLPDA